MAVEEHDSLTGDLRGVLEHEAGDFLEGTKEDQHDLRYLLLASGDAVRVELALLKVREEELGWGGGVRVRGAQHDLHLEVLDAGAGLVAPVVRGSIEEDDDLFPPPDAELLGEDQRHL